MEPVPVTTILVTGATGNQGGAVINALLQPREGFNPLILAATRNESSPAAQRLAALSPRIRLVEGDLDDVNKLFYDAEDAAGDRRPIWGVYSVQVSRGTGVTPESEIKQGKDLVDMAMRYGVQHFVYSSVERGGDLHSWTNPTPVTHFQPKYHIENHLVSACNDTTQNEQQMTWTILRPVAFMENLAADFKTKVFITALRNHLGDRKEMQWVSTADVGFFAAEAFRDAEKWKGRAVGVAGDEMTMPRMLEVLERTTGRAATTYWPLGSLLTTMVKELGSMIGWFASEGYKADVMARRKDHPGLLTMEQWLAGGGGGFVKRELSSPLGL
ncbi:NAD(P)-binding protein [Podospora conica]|nr:NAD(P)-binding protein [Schizothecium conicum]